MTLKPVLLLLTLWLTACTLTAQTPLAENSNSPADDTAAAGTHPIVNIAAIDVEPLLPNCTPRADWTIYTVVRGDIFADLAVQGGITSADLVTANCLVDANQVYVQQELRVPPGFPPTATPSPITVPEHSRVGLSPYTPSEDDRLGLEPGSIVYLGWEPALPAMIERIEFYAISADGIPTRIAVDNNGGDNVWIEWTVPAQFTGQLTAIAYANNTTWAETTDPITVFTTQP